jgi:hypothetical protein
MFHCTSVVVPAGFDARQSARPAHMRQPGYDEEFDAGTLFYDVIRVPGDSLVFVGPPLLNLLGVFYGSRLNGRELSTTWGAYYLRDRCCDVWIQGAPPIEVRLDTPFGSLAVTPQAAAHHLYARRRVLYTLSKDNEIAWIADWVQFHARNHGADAVLLYDNNSSRYSGDAVERELRQQFPDFEIHVVHWPYKYGPQGVSADAGWDSDFCQAGAFQDARFRFLASAASVLNCDIDELVVSPAGTGVFEATERSPDGYLCFAGRWVSNARPAQLNERSSLRHAHFVYVDRDDAAQCPTKWCVVPSRCPVHAHWSTHSIRGIAGEAPAAARFAYRHFRGISTSWKYRRHWPETADSRRHRVDRTLARSFSRAGMLGGTPPGLWSAIGRQLRALAHPDWRM